MIENVIFMSLCKECRFFCPRNGLVVSYGDMTQSHDHLLYNVQLCSSSMNRYDEFLFLFSCFLFLLFSGSVSVLSSRHKATYGIKTLELVVRRVRPGLVGCYGNTMPVSLGGGERGEGEYRVNAQ